MERRNYTPIHDFILVGFSTAPHLQYLLFVIFLCIFMISLLAHTFIILLYRFSPNLHTPMYLLLASFSVLEICYISTVTPKMLINLVSLHNTISFYGCAVQMNCYLLLASTECYILTAMAYDRYNAICHPLLYNRIMRKTVCIRLVIGSWLIGATIGVLQTKLIFSLPFCKSNKINNFYCDIPPLISLACNNTQFNEMVMLIVTFIIIVLPFILIVISYANIIWTILKRHPAGMRKKAFSTCSSHLMVVSMSYWSSTIMYLRPKTSYGNNEEKFLSLMYAVIAPLVNPFIYSLRNKDVKKATEKIICELKIAVRENEKRGACILKISKPS